MTLYSPGKIIENLKKGGELPSKHSNPYLEEALKYLHIIFTSEEISNVQESFPEKGSCIVEIGSYMGKNLIQMASNHPDTNFIGLEITYKRAVKCAQKIHANNLTNAKVGLVSDRIFFPPIPDHSLSGVCLFFPDPWPKKKHAKNRIIRPEFFTLLKEKLVPGGFLWFKTDHGPYMERALEIAQEYGFTASEANEQPEKLSDNEYFTNFEFIFTQKKLPIYRRVFYSPDKSLKDNTRSKN